ncbi:MAG: hypothetical protein AAGA05_08455 [Pseudomonadota bacterium]
MPAAPAFARLSGIVALVAILSPVVLHAQMSARLRLEPEAGSQVANGAVIGSEFFDYVFTARAGQVLSAGLAVTDTNGAGSAHFDILSPGDGGALFDGSGATMPSGSVKLPRDGDYRVRVYLSGEDRDTGKTVGFALTLTIR